MSVQCCTLYERSDNSRDLILLSEAALADKKPEVAKTWVERLIALQKRPTTQATQKDETKPISLPARMIISVEKSLLDQISAEEITFEDFKKKTSVQHLSLAGE